MRELRLMILEDTFKRYKIYCVEHDISLPKQTAELIRKFLEIQEENAAKIKAAKQKGV
jgi:hypothetical protein